jgi:Ca2+/Na+ antiporter
MKTSEELSELYEKQLKPSLVSLESKRKSIILRKVIYLLLIPVVIAMAIFLGDKQEYFLYIGLALVLFLVFKYYMLRKDKAEYRHDFKEKVVREVVRMINPDWNYYPDDRISQDDYFKSNLFPDDVDRYTGDDKVEGVIDKTDFQFSELHTEYKSETRDDDGRKEETWHTIFKGIFFHADFNKEIKGKTLVLPDTAEKLFGSLGKKLQTLSGRGQLIKMEDVEFEKLFVVYGSDQIESRYVLTPSMMRSMIAIKKKYKKNVYFSFIGSRIYVAISIKKDLFEPRLLRSGVRFSDIEHMNEYFSVIETIINEMNLNTRIWTKD